MEGAQFDIPTSDRPTTQSNASKPSGDTEAVHRIEDAYLAFDPNGRYNG